MKKILGIVGVSVVAGVITYAVYKKLHNKNTKEFEKNNTVPNDNLGEEQNYEETLTADMSEIDMVKSEVAENIQTRHEEAAEIMKNAIDVIYKRTDIVKLDNDDVDDELDEIANGLNELLSED